jgi:hypothetical protein
VGLGLCPPLANADPFQIKSNAAVNTKQVFVPNIAVYIHIAAAQKSIRQE